MNWKKIIAVTAISLATIQIIWTLWLIDDWKRDLSQNYARTDANSPDVNLQPVRSQATPQMQAEILMAWVGNHSRWTAVSTEQSPDGTIAIHLVRTTLVFRFKDDIHVTIRPLAEGGSLVEAESQSRVGKGDLGQNPRNLRELLAGLRK